MIFDRLFSNLNYLFSGFRFPEDLLDILIVWFIVYRTLLLVKKTSAAQMLSGLGIVAIIYIVSISTELSALNWVLNKFFSYLIIVIVVLFQSEIRRTLAHIGRNPFFTGVSELEETHVLEEIAKGAILCAQKGFGALIVIEREIGLEDFIEKGVKLDSTITSELINSIFLPQSPLHDGALIVRGGKAYAARCFLPLSKSPNIDGNLGTRHRAAIGLTEETDSLVIVVSEENNQVSVVLGGEMTPDVDHAELRKTLYSLFSLQDDQKLGIKST